MSDERPQEPLPEEPLPPQASSGKPSLEKAPLPAPAPAPTPAPMPAAAPALRASDADRERVVERLRDAVAEGRLDMDEFGERLEAAYKSRTYAELEPLTRDLPAVPGEAPLGAAAATPAGTAPAEGAWSGRIGGSGTSATAVAVMSGFQRKGRWTVPARFNAVAFWGGGDLDLREADFSQREVVITCVAIMGGIQITVPPGVEVDVRGIGVMGAFDQSGTQIAPQPGAPRVVVNGLAFWGGVEVRTKAPKGPKPVNGKRPRKEL
ncbi:DUF1707 domain-containing protein [Streptomyces sp. NPDC048507]|uniref:DUF1707 SHOCT-like domain-containing protein n=1 Tax=Streptomyces sp. NPDC048507 TaxID=3365560 RepID=UPI00371C493E